MELYVHQMFGGKYSPLHVAARAGNVDIFKSILSAFPDSLNCEVSGGLVPLYTSIRYQALEIFKFCMDIETKYIFCSEQSQLMKAIHSKSMSFQSSCVAGMTVTHFLAIYDSKDMVSAADRKRIDMDIHRKDYNGVTPVHYAACNGNLMFLMIVDRLGIDIDVITTTTGLSPYHSAVSCLSARGLVILANHIGSQSLPSVFDGFDRSLLNYLVMIPLEKDWGHLERKTEFQTLDLFKFILNNSDTRLVFNTNKTGKNFLYYVLKNGHFYCVEYFLNTYIDESIKLLRQNDSTGEDPVTYTIQSLQHIEKSTSTEYHIPDLYYHIDLAEAYKMTNADYELRNHLWLLSPVELCLHAVMAFAYKHDVMDGLINEHFGSLMLK